MSLEKNHTHKSMTSLYSDNNDNTICNHFSGLTAYNYDCENSPHMHRHENTKAVLNRMNRAIGHMESIKTMIKGGRDCSEILVQIAAVRSAINNIGKIILEDHINHCVVEAIETGDKQVLEELDEAINKFVK